MADKNDTRKSPEQIRQEMADTRQRMAANMDVLQDRLNPQRLKQEATDKIRDNTVGRVERFADNATENVKGASTDVFETIKENPLPAALAAIGLGWLLMESRSDKRKFARQTRENRGWDRYSRYEYNRRDRFDPYNQYERDDYRFAAPEFENRGTQGQYQGRSMGDRFQQAGGQVQDKAQNVASSVQDKAQQVAGSVQDTAQQVAGSVQDTAQQVADSVQDTAQQVAGSVQQFAGQAGDQIQEGAYRVRSRFEELMDENPLIVGAAAVAFGAAIGMSLPSTSKEDELLGSARDKVMDRAQDTAQETMQKVQQVATKAGDAAKEAAKDEAQKQNLTTNANG